MRQLDSMIQEGELQIVKMNSDIHTVLIFKFRPVLALPEAADEVLCWIIPT